MTLTNRRIIAGIVGIGAALGTVVMTVQPAGATTPPDAEPSGPFCASIPPDGPGSFVGMAADPVATAASNNPYLTTLASAVETAGLTDALNGPGPFTVFAPSNEAFGKVPPADLAALVADPAALAGVLTQHVVDGESVSSADLLERGSLTTMDGNEITFTEGASGEVIINGGVAVVTCADIPTANATVHIIDTVLGAPEMELPGSL